MQARGKARAFAHAGRETQVAPRWAPDPLIAYIVGDDVQQASYRKRDKFRKVHPVEFDPAGWRTEADWLVALRKRPNE